MNPVDPKILDALSLPPGSSVEDVIKEITVLKGWDPGRRPDLILRLRFGPASP